MTPVPDRAKAIEAMARQIDPKAWDPRAARLASGREWRRVSLLRAEAALAALEELGWGLTSTREAERLREALRQARTDLIDVNCAGFDSTRGNLALAAIGRIDEALSSVPVEEEERQPPSEDERRDIARHASEESDRCVACEGSGTHHAMGWLSPPAPCPSCGGSGRDTKGTGL